MPLNKLSADDVGMPPFTVSAPPQPGESLHQAFNLSSHARAGTALELGLAVPGSLYNIFVIGPDRAGRMTATKVFAEAWAKEKGGAEDWLYVFNFAIPHEPKPMSVPAGAGRALAEAMDELIPALARELAAAFSSEAYQSQIVALRSKDEAEIQGRLTSLEQDARQEGLALHNTPQGAVINAIGEDGEVVPMGMLEPEQRAKVEESSRQIMERLAEINRDLMRVQRRFFDAVKEFNKVVAERTCQGLIQNVAEQFASVPVVAEWLANLGVDVIEHYRLFLAEDGTAEPSQALGRYRANLLVDRQGNNRCPVIVEQNPSYENLFGRIEYRQMPGGGLDTDVSLIRAGALHQANGGVLILRGDALAAQPALWGFLKAALRDREVRIEEFYRAGSPPIAGAPKPQAVPLDVKVIVVSSPQFYYGYFSQDPEFSSYFKIKAEIEGDVEVNPENVARYIELLVSSKECRHLSIEPAALSKLLGMSARWAQNREKLTSAYEKLADLVVEAAHLAGGVETITEAQVTQAIQARRRRNALIEDRIHEAIEDDVTLIDVQGSVIGQINGLTVQTVGDHAFGSPSRITARASVGRKGVVNIERMVALSGPIQQKGAMVLQGILLRKFARTMPLSFDCSITFEQMYGGVEGDSASMAEYVAIISDLAEVPVRQDIAITGSINQLGVAQVIGGAHHKIEGFFRACESAPGGLTGTQGVIIPAANEVNLVLRDDVAAAVTQGQFHIWSVELVEEAIELYTGMPVNVDAADGVYARVVKTLERFDQSLTVRGI